MRAPDSEKVRTLLASVKLAWKEKPTYNSINELFESVSLSDEKVQRELALYLADREKPHRRAVLAAIIDRDCIPTSELDLVVETYCLPDEQLNFLAKMFLGID